MTLARWASIFFSLSVLSYIFSIAITQSFLFLAAVTYAVHLFRDHPRITFPHIKLPLLLFCFFTIISAFWAETPAASGYPIRKLVLFIIILLAVNLIVTRPHLEFIWKGLFVEAAISGLLAIWQFVMQYTSVRAAHPHKIYFYMNLQRATGFMGDWINFGGQQMLVFAFFAAFILFVMWRRKIWWIVLAIVVLSIILNMTRGAWLGCFFALIYLLWRWKPKWVLALPVLALLIYFFSPRIVHQRLYLALHPTRDPALAIRFQMWETGLNMIKAHPWVGVGTGNIPEAYFLYFPKGKKPMAGYHGHLHDNIIQFAAERGLPCMLAWVWLMVAILWEIWQIRRRAGPGRWLVDGAIAAWIAFVVEGMFEFNFGTSPTLMVFLFVISTPYIVGRIEALHKEQPQAN